MRFSEHALRAALRRLGAVTQFRVAYSGGPDSSVLLDALAGCRDVLAVPVVAVHVDHALLPQSAAWAAHCRAVCAALHVPLEVLRVDVGPHRAALGVEAAARRARYEAFAALLTPGECLLTAHHRDDQAETVLLQLIRGSGPAGLAAMPFVAPLGRGRLARPLLAFDRIELAAYAATRAISYVEDPSNCDLGLGRGFLRARVMPVLHARWPGVAHTLARTARHAADATAIIAERAAEDLVAIAGTTPWRVSVHALGRLSVPRRRAVLRYWCHERGVPLPDTTRLDELVDQLATAGVERAPQVAWPGGGFRRYRDELRLSPDLPAHDAAARLSWDGATSLLLPAGLGVLRLAPGGPLRRGVLKGGVEVRFRAAGLRCAPAGRKGHHALKQLFQEAGVPPWLRERIPLIFCGGQLAAIADRWVCAEFAASGRETGLRVSWERPDHLEPWLSAELP